MKVGFKINPIKGCYSFEFESNQHPPPPLVLLVIRQTFWEVDITNFNFAIEAENSQKKTFGFIVYTLNNIEDFPIRKIKVFSRIYKSLLWCYAGKIRFYK